MQRKEEIMNEIRLKDGFCKLLNADCEFKIVGGKGLQIKVKENVEQKNVFYKLLMADNYSKLFKDFIQVDFDETDNSLVIYIGYESRAFADMEYLKLIGHDVFDKSSKHFGEGTTTDIVKKHYQLEVIPL